MPQVRTNMTQFNGDDLSPSLLRNTSDMLERNTHLSRMDPLFPIIFLMVSPSRIIEFILNENKYVYFMLDELLEIAIPDDKQVNT